MYDQLSRIGKIELPEFHPILGSQKIQEYRNKLEFGCANKRWYTREEIAQLPPKKEGEEGNLKEGDELQTALEIQSWNNWLAKQTDYSTDFEEFDKEYQNIVD